MRVLGKVWPVLGVLCALLSGCGGDDGGAVSSDSSTVNTRGTEGISANTLSVNVRQVLTSFHTKAGSYTLIGSVNGVDQQLTLDVPKDDSSWSGEPNTAISVTLFDGFWGDGFWGAWVDDSRTVRKLETRFDFFYSIFFRLLGADWDLTLPIGFNGGYYAVFLPVDAKVGASGFLADLRYSFFNVDGPSVLLSRNAEFTYSVEAASTADTAWVCENSKETGSAGVVDYRHQLCVLTNSSSELLGVRFAVQTFDANGLLKKSGVFNAS